VIAISKDDTGKNNQDRLTCSRPQISESASM
jgi:hypothetical protein